MLSFKICTGIILIINLEFIFCDPISIYEIEDVPSDNQLIKQRFSVTFPGTRWCGPGNTANDYDDLGRYQETDKCCRDHDHCENIPAGEEKYGLTNDDWFTRLHCDCDKEFYECLHAANGTVSTVIGTQYFLARNRCYKEAPPIMECIRYQSRIFIRRCIEYSYNTTEPPLYQWFDLPLYDIAQFPEEDQDEIVFYTRGNDCQQESALETNNIK